MKQIAKTRKKVHIRIFCTAACVNQRPDKQNYDDTKEKLQLIACNLFLLFGHNTQIKKRYGNKKNSESENSEKETAYHCPDI